jgi:hypothetical protein
MGNINFPGGELWETLGKTLGWEMGKPWAEKGPKKEKNI